MSHVHLHSASPRAAARRRRAASLALAGVGMLAVLGLAALPAAAVPGPVGLGTATSFAVLAGSGITNTGPTTITGDVGTFPTITETGFASITLLGTNHAGDAVTQGAKASLLAAYNDAFGRTPATSIPVELGNTTLFSGVYTSPTFGLTGTLTLDGQGDPNSQWIFQAGSTLIAEANSRVVLINGANPCHVVWQVGSSATFKTGTSFAGDVLADTSITAQTTATFRGRLLALDGAVTLDTNTISRSTCQVTVPTTTPTTTPAATGGTVPSGTSPVAGGAVATTSAGTGSSTPTGSASGTPTGTSTGSGAPRLPSTGGPYAAIAAFGLTLVALGSALRRQGRRPRGAHLPKD
jgi:type VI secretion system secreted protein VgrG